MKNSYEFTLKFDLPDSQETADKYEDALFEAGCDDALIGSGVTGRVALEFTREAESAKKAVFSAIDNVLDAIPDAVLTEASPDLVTLSDLADILGCSRQNLRKYYAGNTVREKRFPSPVAVCGKTGIWHLTMAGRWLEQYSDLNIPKNQLEVSQVAFEINLKRDQGYLTSWG